MTLWVSPAARQPARLCHLRSRTPVASCTSVALSRGSRGLTLFRDGNSGGVVPRLRGSGGVSGGGTGQKRQPSGGGSEGDGEEPGALRRLPPRPSRANCAGGRRASCCPRMHRRLRPRRRPARPLTGSVLGQRQRTQSWTSGPCRAEEPDGMGGCRRSAQLRRSLRTWADVVELGAVPTDRVLRWNQSRLRPGLLPPPLWTVGARA